MASHFENTAQFRQSCPVGQEMDSYVLVCLSMFSVTMFIMIESYMNFQDCSLLKSI